MFVFTKRFKTSNEALIEMASCSGVISQLVFVECPPTMDMIDQFDENELRINAIRSLCTELCENTPDRTRDAFPEVPSFTVNAYDFFYKTGRNIGFGVSYNRDTDEYIGKIVMYLNYRYAKINPVIKYLSSEENGWTQEENQRRYNRYNKTEGNDTTTTTSESTTQSVEVTVTD